MNVLEIPFSNGKFQNGRQAGANNSTMSHYLSKIRRLAYNLVMNRWQIDGQNLAEA